MADDSIPPEPPYTLSEVVVLAQRHPVNRAATVYERDRRHIEERAVRSAGEALAHVPGLYLYRTARNEHTFRLRGFEQRQVSVFLDGVPISIPYDGLVDVAQLAGDDIERVQVSHGFSSMLYGANSLGGSVNLMTTAPAREPSLTARLEHSDHGRTFGTLAAGGGTRQLRFSGSVAVDRADAFRLSGDYAPALNEDGGARENSGFSRKRFALKAHWLASPAHQVGVHLSGVDNEYGVPPNAESAWARYWRFPVWRRTLASINTRHTFGERLSVRTVWYHDGYDNLLRSFDDATYTTQQRGYAFDSEYDDRSRGVILYPTLQLLPFGATDAVISYRKDVHRERDDDEPFQRFAAATLMLGIEQDVAFSPGLGMVAGVNVNLLFPEQSAGAPAADPLRQVNAQWALEHRHGPALSTHVAVSRKSRFPTLKELHSNRLGTSIPNADLRSENSLHAEVGADLEIHGWYTGISLFHSAARDLIASVALGAGQHQMQNISRARLSGAEIEVGREWRRASVVANYAYLHAVDASPERASRHLEYRPAHRLNALVTLRPHERLRIGAAGTFTGAQHYRNPDTGVWEELHDIAWLDVHLEHRLLGGLYWTARVDNVLDGNFSSGFGIPLPGREMSIGLRAALR